jgi:hypothetical protein
MPTLTGSTAICLRNVSRLANLIEYWRPLFAEVSSTIKYQQSFDIP